MSCRYATFAKLDVVSAYQSLKYSKVIELIERETPRAKEALMLLKFVGEIAPEGHLIIGGYIDAWLFNFAMSYAVREAYKSGRTRRGKTIRDVTRIVTYMDDLLLLTPSIKATKTAIKAISKYLDKEMSLKIKQTSGIVKLFSIEEERNRRLEKSKLLSGVPMIDMAGYRISRTHTTIRARTFKKLRRQYLRAWREYTEEMTMSEKRARAIISYHGYIKETDSYRIAIKYHDADLLEIATRVVSAKAKYRERMKDDGIRARTGKRGSSSGIDGKSSGCQDESNPDKGQSTG